MYVRSMYVRSMYEAHIHTNRGTVTSIKTYILSISSRSLRAFGRSTLLPSTSTCTKPGRQHGVGDQTKAYLELVCV